MLKLLNHVKLRQKSMNKAHFHVGSNAVKKLQWHITADKFKNLYAASLTDIWNDK